VKLSHQLVGGGGDNRTRLDDLLFTLPAFPKTGKGDWLLIAPVDEVRDLEVGIALLFIEIHWRVLSTAWP
jgi:hypothetical protein